MDINQDIVNSTITIIDALKKNWKHKKGWRSNQIGINKGSDNYDLFIDNDYSQVLAAIGLRVVPAPDGTIYLVDINGTC